ncbi:hypothetical protein CMUS01_16534 [Colletotrichum musicola]|uniref:Uncharacterized protein n=1 Tax=Colletotrichum musicola TaxID=2175873 RepID=A0A8H6IMX2_9PEZI|nr:hypothetical protein CMUS01_16534 [Colletotrichum musicola]
MGAEDDKKQPQSQSQPQYLELPNESPYQSPYQSPATPTRRPKRSHAKHVLSYWGLELFTLFCAVCLLAAIIALLAYYDGRYMPEWPFEINLNSAVAFLSTFLRGAIVAAVAEIIGQIKWTWFTEQSRPLHHLQDFDAASRSIVGSTKLLGVVLWNMGFSSAGLLTIGAAVVTIASLAVGPVTQQAVRTVTCPMLSKNLTSSIPAANYVPGSSAYYRVGAGMYELEVDMQVAMIQGITDPGRGFNDVQVSCSSGNCTWPDYGTGVTHASIGMCSSCLDTTGFVSPPDETGNLTLPDDGAVINVLSGEYMWMGYSNLTAYRQLFTSDFTRAASVSFANFSMLMISKAPCATDNSTGTPKLLCPHRLSQSTDAFFQGIGDYVAASCILYPCLTEYSARYRNNTLMEDVVRTTTAVVNAAELPEDESLFAGFANYTARQSPCILDNGTWYTGANQSKALEVPGRTWTNFSDPELDGAVSRVPNACLYKMDGTYFSALSRFINSVLLSASCRYDSIQSGHINCGGAWWLTTLWRENNATANSLALAVDDFAWAVTNKLRMTGLGPDIGRGSPDILAGFRNASVKGEVWESTTCTNFDRDYIALPAALVGMCAFLLGWIMVKNHNDPDQPVWKGSVLPLLFFGLHDTVGPQGQAGAGAGVGGQRDRSADGRLARNVSFFRENGRPAPELERIQQQSGRIWVRFHGGTDPGFLDLGRGRRADPEGGSAAELVPDGDGKKGSAAAR